VTDFDTMVANIGNLSDTALAKFDQQVAVATAMTSSVSGAITAMKDSAALTAQLQQNYLEQAVMLQDATGTGTMEWTCDRTLYYPLHFAVNRQVQHVACECISAAACLCDHEAIMPDCTITCHVKVSKAEVESGDLPSLSSDGVTDRAHGQAEVSDCTNVQDRTGSCRFHCIWKAPAGCGCGRRSGRAWRHSWQPPQLGMWGGSQLSEVAALRHRLLHDATSEEPTRYIGAAGGQNKVVAGLFPARQHSKTRDAECSSESPWFSFGMLAPAAFHIKQCTQTKLGRRPLSLISVHCCMMGTVGVNYGIVLLLWQVGGCRLCLMLLASAQLWPWLATRTRLLQYLLRSWTLGTTMHVYPGLG